MIFKIHQNYYYPTLGEDKSFYSLEIDKKDPFASVGGSIPLSFIRYAFNTETIKDVQKGFVALNQVSGIEIIPLVPGGEFSSKDWRNGALVAKVEGPFQDNALVTEIDQKKPVYYLATARTKDMLPPNDVQLLSIKWEYQYNGGAFATFKNSKRSVVTDGGVKKCKIECSFHERTDILDIAMYAFFNEKDPNISKKCPTLNKIIAQQNQDTPGKLIWSAKVTPEFEEKVIQICGELWGEDQKMMMANALMAVMAAETAKTFKAHVIEGKPLKDVKTLTKADFYKTTAAGERSSRAVGLIQFTQPALQSLGDFTQGSGFDKLDEVKLMYAQMGEIKQLDKVKQYFEKSKDRIKSHEDIYLQVFAPVGVGKAGTFVLYAYNTDPKKNVDFDSNKSLDYKKNGGNGNLKIERWELLKRYYKVFNEGKEHIRKPGAKGTSETDQTEDEETEDIPTTGWHDPIDNPMLCLYTQKGNLRPRYNVFGTVRKERENHNHQGVDLLGVPGTNVYACVDCTIVSAYDQGKGYGKSILLKVKDKEAFLKFKRNFKVTYGSQGELLTGSGFTFDGDFYLFYAHLKTILISVDDKEVAAGKVIGHVGTSGYGVSKDPHLHFEIRNKTSGSGLNNRCNPGYFVKYKDDASMTAEEKAYHKEIAQKDWE